MEVQGEMGKIELTNSGLKFEGCWKEICDFSQELEEMMEKYLQSEEEIDEFEEWRPHLKDSDEEMKDKTAEKATVDEKKIEKNFEGVKKELDEAEEKLLESIEDIRDGIDPCKDLKEALLEVEKVMGVESIRSLRTIEKTIYKRLMLKMNPYYFDTSDFSVNLEIKRNSIYCLRVNVTDENLREHLQEISL